MEVRSWWRCGPNDPKPEIFYSRTTLNGAFMRSLPSHEGATWQVQISSPETKTGHQGNPTWDAGCANHAPREHGAYTLAVEDYRYYTLDGGGPCGGA